MDKHTARDLVGWAWLLRASATRISSQNSSADVAEEQSTTVHEKLNVFEHIYCTHQLFKALSYAWRYGGMSTKDSSLPTSPIHSSVVSMRRCSCAIKQRSTATSRSDSSWARSLRSQSAIVGTIVCWGCAHDLLPLSWVWMVSCHDAWVSNHNGYSCRVLGKRRMH